MLLLQRLYVRCGIQVNYHLKDLSLLTTLSETAWMAHGLKLVQLEFHEQSKGQGSLKAEDGEHIPVSPCLMLVRASLMNGEENTSY